MARTKLSAKVAKILSLIQHRRARARVNGRGPLGPDRSDWLRLADGEFLNDALLDYFLSHLVSRLGAGRVHAFSSLFFTRLREGGWSAVRTWTRSLKREAPVGIFAKDFLLVPVHDADLQHWWLAVICRPGAAGQAYASASSSSAAAQPQGVCCIAFLDSLTTADPEAAAAREARATRLLREYLVGEWTESLAVGSYDEGRVTPVTIEVPQQTNGADCGVFVLEFALRLLKDHEILESLGTKPVSMPQLLEAPRRRWRALGAELVAKAQKQSSSAAPVRTPTRAPTHNSGVCTPERNSPEEGQRAKRPRTGDQPDSPRIEKQARKIDSASETRAQHVTGNKGTSSKAASIVLWVSEAVSCSLTSKHRAALSSMGGEICSDHEGSGASHLVIAGPLRRTLKVMCAISRGMHIVRADWLDSCMRACDWQAEDAYLPEADDTAVAAARPHLTEVLRRARRRGLLLDHTVYIDPGLPEASALASLARAAAAVIASSESEATLVVASARAVAAKSASRGVPIRMTPDRFFEVAMRQDLFFS